MVCICLRFAILGCIFYLFINICSIELALLAGIVFV